MTIDISNNNPRINYSVASGVTQTSFVVPFEFFDDADVNVYVDEVLKTITTDYTVSGGSGSTGTITMSVTGPATVSLTRDTVIERTTDFTAGVDINRAALNTQLDTLTAIAADNKDYVERAIRVQDLEIAPNLVLPSKADRAGKLMSFDSYGGVTTPTTTSAQLDAAVSSFVNATGNNAASILYDPAGTGAQQSTVQAKLREFVSVKDFGAVGDGVTDDTAAIQAAINAASAGDVVSLSGGTYRVDSTITLKSDLTFRDGTLDFSNGTAFDPCLTAVGSIASGLSLTANITTIGDTTCTVADSSSLSEHDWLLLHSNAVYDASNTNTKIGEIVQVQSQSSGTITLRGGTCDTYATADSAQVQKITFVENLTIENIQVIGNDTDNNDLQGLYVLYGKNIVVDNCRFERLTSFHIQMVDCIFSRVSNSYFEDAYDNSTGYGMSWGAASQDCITENCSFLYVRHSLSTNNPTANPGIVRRIKFIGNTVTNSAQATGGSGGDAIDTHGAAEDIEILNNTCIGSTSQGINVECRSATIIGNTIINSVGNGIAFHNESDRSGRCIVSNNRVIRSNGSAGIYVFQGTRGTTAKNVATIITDNLVEDVNGLGIYLNRTNADNTGVTLSGNNVYGSSGDAIQVYYCDNISISNNVVRNPATLAMDIRYSNYFTASGNDLYSNLTTGDMFLIEDCTGFSVTGNTVVRDAGSGTGNAAQINGDSFDWVFSSNTLLNDDATCLNITCNAGTDTNGIITSNRIGPVSGTNTAQGIVISNNNTYTLVHANNVRSTGGITLGTGTGNVSSDNIT